MFLCVFSKSRTSQLDESRESSKAEANKVSGAKVFPTLKKRIWAREVAFDGLWTLDSRNIERYQLQSLGWILQWVHQCFVSCLQGRNKVLLAKQPRQTNVRNLNERLKAPSPCPHCQLVFRRRSHYHEHRPELPSACALCWRNHVAVALKRWRTAMSAHLPGEGRSKVTEPLSGSSKKKVASNLQTPLSRRCRASVK